MKILPLRNASAPNSHNVSPLVRCVMCARKMWASVLMKCREILHQEVVRYNPSGVLLSRHSTASANVLLSVEYQGAEIWHKGSAVHIPLAPEPGEMFHFALVFQQMDSEVEGLVYINGNMASRYILSAQAADALSNCSATDFPSFPWILGARLQEIGGEWLTDDRPFGGVLDELRWWSINRSLEEIRETMFQMNLKEQESGCCSGALVKLP